MLFCSVRTPSPDPGSNRTHKFICCCCCSRSLHVNRLLFALASSFVVFRIRSLPVSCVIFFTDKFNQCGIFFFFFLYFSFFYSFPSRPVCRRFFSSSSRTRDFRLNSDNTRKLWSNLFGERNNTHNSSRAGEREHRMKSQVFSPLFFHVLFLSWPSLACVVVLLRHRHRSQQRIVTGKFIHNFSLTLTVRGDFMMLDAAYDSFVHFFLSCFIDWFLIFWSYNRPIESRRELFQFFCYRCYIVRWMEIPQMRRVRSRGITDEIVYLRNKVM